MRTGNRPLSPRRSSRERRLPRKKPSGHFRLASWILRWRPGSCGFSLGDANPNNHSAGESDLIEINFVQAVRSASAPAEFGIRVFASDINRLGMPVVVKTRYEELLSVPDLR